MWQGRDRTLCKRLPQPAATIGPACAITRRSRHQELLILCARIDFNP